MYGNSDCRDGSKVKGIEFDPWTPWWKETPTTLHTHTHISLITMLKKRYKFNLALRSFFLANLYLIFSFLYLKLEMLIS